MRERDEGDRSGGVFRFGVKMNEVDGELRSDPSFFLNGDAQGDDWSAGDEPIRVGLRLNDALPSCEGEEREVKLCGSDGAIVSGRGEGVEGVGECDVNVIWRGDGEMVLCGVELSNLVLRRSV